VSTPLGPAGWHPDPVGRYEYRYYNGTQWTADVSVNGSRFVDPAGVPTWAPVQATPRRGMAVASFVIGLIALAGALLPFVFVVAAVGAVIAIVFAVLGLRSAARHDGHGRGFAITGLVLSVVALPMCLVGLAFTRTVLREIDQYADPGPYTVAITACRVSGNAPILMEGTIRNDDNVVHTYSIDLEFRFTDGDSEMQTVAVEDVEPGETETFRSTALVFGDLQTECRVANVWGPPPFDIPQQ
jgi:hypothetical protein